MELLIANYRRRLTGLSLSHVWRGHGSAVFFEFGELQEHKSKSGAARNPFGQFGAMIQWSWRIERDNSILCGSWSDDALWEPNFSGLKNATATDLQVFGQIPEIVISLSNGHRIISFMTAEGDPQWTLFDRSSKLETWLCVRDGTVVEDKST